MKETAARLLESMGPDRTTAIDMYYRQIIKERRLPFQPAPALTLDEQLTEAMRGKNIPYKTVDVNTDGHIIADKDKAPDLCDLAVSG